MRWITQARVQALLRSSGYDLEDRRLTDWRSTREDRPAVLPTLERPRDLNSGTSAPQYRWPYEVLVQAYTVCDALEQHKRMDYAMLCAWWSGHEYPLEDMRRFWVRFADAERRVLTKGALDEEADLADVAEIIEDLPNMLRQAHRVLRQLPPTLFDTQVRMWYDAEFRAHSLSPQQAAALVADVMRAAKQADESGELRTMISAEWVRAVVDFLHSYFAPSTAPELLRTMKGDELAQIHADWRVLSGGYRWLMARAIEDEEKGTGGKRGLLVEFLPRNAAKLGRAFMLCDLALRRSAHAKAWERTVHLLRQLAAHIAVPGTADAMMRFQSVYIAVEPLPEPETVLAAWRTLVVEHPDTAALLDRAKRTAGEIWVLWKPVIEPILAALDGRARPPIG
jgi:hypothetical protein